MKPIKLKIKGLNSFCEEQEIKFENLTEKGIFGIFGPTGSGKSTIIDAVTLALYGRISRYSQTRSTLKDAINAESDTMQVELIFEVNGCVYESVRGYKRDKENIKNTIARLVSIDNGETNVLCDKPKEIDKKIEEIIGLTYSDFTRSVVLPQGKFSEFLLLDGPERGAMLERIFNLGIYGDILTQKIKGAIYEAKNEIYTIQTVLNEIGDVSQETLKSKKEELVSKIEENKLLKRKLSDLRQEETVANANAKIYNDLLEAKEKLKRLLEQKQIVDEMRLKLANGQKAIVLKPFCDALDKTEKRLVIAEKNFKSSENVLEKLNAEIDGIKKLSEQLPVLTVCADIKLLNKEIKTLRSGYKALTEKIKVNVENKDNLERELEKIKTELTNGAERKKQLYVSSEEREAAINAIGLCDKYKELTEQNRKSEVQLEKHKVILESDRNKLSEYKNEIDRFKSEIKGLGDGKPCPTCGAITHPIVNKNNEEIQKLNIITAQFEERIASGKRLWEEFEREISKNSQNLKEWGETLAAYEITLKTNDFKAAYEKIKKSDAEIESINNKEDSFRKKEDSLKVELNKVNNNISDANWETEKIKAIGQEKRNVIDKLLKQVSELIKNESPEDFYKETEKNVGELLNKSKNAKSVFDELTKEIEKQKETFIQNKTEIEMLKERQGEEKEKLQLKLNENNISDVSFVISWWIDDEAYQKLENHILNYEDENKRLSGVVVQLAEKLTGVDTQHIFDKCTELKNNIENAQDLIDKNNKTIAVLEVTIEKTEENIKKAVEYNKRKVVFQKKQAQCEELAKLFEGKRFVKYLAKRQLSYIAADATNRLKGMTSGRYALKLVDTEFFIRDDYNGGVHRPPKSLSGGETFIVSLCLALALSSKIQLKSHAPLNFFFLDEGFGTLDNNLLDNVMNALEKLKYDNLSVGIISHVEEIKNRVYDKINVVPPKTGKHGSMVLDSR